MGANDRGEKLRVALAENEALRAELQAALNEIKILESFHPRAAKLMRKRKSFLVVAEDEPYYIDTYLTIRIHEIEIGRWTDEDERLFQAAWKAAIKA